ncbi:MAG TPA: hypothetical protein VI685_02075, partial [Candidatus Angelobacter sp.]
CLMSGAHLAGLFHFGTVKENLDIYHSFLLRTLFGRYTLFAASLLRLYKHDLAGDFRFLAHPVIRKQLS